MPELTSAFSLKQAAPAHAYAEASNAWQEPSERVPVSRSAPHPQRDAMAERAKSRPRTNTTGPNHPPPRSSTTNSGRRNSAKPSMSHDGVPFTEGHLTHDEKKALYAVFRSIDRDGNDKIHFDEIRRVYGGDANGLFHLLDANHDGQVTLHFNLQDPCDD